MPWAERNRMSLREEFVHLVESQRVSMTELCRRFQISRKTGYKWVQRFGAEGAAGLTDRSRRPHQLHYQVPEATQQFLLAERREHPAWGARKLRQRAYVEGLPAVPACSTITALLKRADLIDLAESSATSAWQRFEHPAPNDLWQMDFRGPVATRAASCHALTILDDHSRFNLCLQTLPSQKDGPVQATLVKIFRQYGLPNRLLTDNGSPWGHTAAHPYTVLTVWLLRVGIRISHSRPYHPQTMGKDERFHGSLTREVLSQAQWRDVSYLQQVLDRWRQVYNHVRPHEALELAAPGGVGTNRDYGPIPKRCPRLSMIRVSSCARSSKKAKSCFGGRCLMSVKPSAGTRWALPQPRKRVDMRYDFVITQLRRLIYVNLTINLAIK